VENRLVCLGPQDVHARLEVGLLYVDHQSPFQAGPHLAAKRLHVFGRAISCDNYLPVAAVQFIEGVEEALQCLFLVDQEVNVIEQQEVDVSELAAEPVNLILSHRRNELIGKLLGSSVGRFQSMVTGQMADGVKQVCLTLPGAAVDEERVVTGSRILSHLHGGGISQTVEIADDKVVEGVSGVEYVLGGFCACPAVGVVHREGWCLFSVVNKELHVNISTHNGYQCLPHQRIETFRQPLGDKDAGNTDDEEVVVVG